MTQQHRRLSSPTQGFPPGPRGFTSPSQNGQRDDAPSKEHVEDAGICLSLRIRACPRGRRGRTRTRGHLIPQSSCIFTLSGLGCFVRVLIQVFHY